MNGFNPDNAIAVNQTSQGTTPADTGSFNVDNAVPVNETNNGNTDWESFKNNTNTPKEDSNAPEVSDATSDSADKVGEPSSAAVTSEAPLNDNKGPSKKVLDNKVSRETSKEKADVKPHQTVPSPDYPPENWLNATVHSAEGSVWNSFVKPFSKPQPDMDQYLGQLEKKHPIASVIGGTALFIASAPFLPESLVPNIYLRTAAQFGLVGLGQGINKARQDQSRQLMDKASDVAQETLKSMAYGPVFAKAQSLRVLDRPFQTALARAGVIASGSGIMSTMFGDNLSDAFKQGGLYGALSLIAESPHLAGSVLGRGIINHTNSLYADMAAKAGLPDIKMDVDQNYKPESTEDLTTKKYHVREISDLLSVSEAGGLIKSDEGNYSRLESGWPSFLTDKGYNRDDLNNIFNKFLNDKELTDKQQSTLNTVLKDAEPFTKGLTPLQKQIHTVMTAMADQVPGIHDPQIISATVKLPDGTQIHGASHQDALSKIGEKKGVYHGSGVKFEKFDESMKGSITGAISAKGAIWFTDDPKVAKAYSIYAAETGAVTKKMAEADQAEKIAKKSGKQEDWDKHDALMGEAEELDTYDKTFDRRKDANVKEAYLNGDFLVVDAEGKTPQELSADADIDSWLNEQIKKAKSLGKDGVKFNNLDDAIGLYNHPATHYAIFDPKNIMNFDAGFTVHNPDGTTKFITREESMKPPFNLPNGESEDVKGLNESKWMDHQEPEITNPDTMAMIANNEGKMDLNMVPLTAEAAEVFQKSHQELKEKFAPYTVGKEGQYTAEVLREQLGEFARSNDRMDVSTKKARDIFQKAKNEDNLDFMDKFEAGKNQDTSDLQKIADTLRDIDDKDWEALKGTGKINEENFIANHLPHYWDRSKDMINMIKKVFGRRPWEGPKSFKKHRVFTTMREGVDAGFTPSSYNPVDFIMWRHREVTKYIAALNTKAALKEQGLRVFVRTGAAKPDGWVKINDNAEEVYYTNDAKELVKSGVYYTQPDAARIIDNYLTPGIAGKSYIYDLYRGAGNTLNQFQLGISAFHLGFTSMDATISKFALGINKLSTGDFAGAVKEFGKAPFAPITNILQGRQLLQAWYGKDMGELTNTIADLMASGGGRARMDKFYATGMKDSLNKSIKEGKIATAAFKVPFYIVEQVARPIMEYIVPRQKMGVFMDMMKMEMERNPGMSHQEMRGLAQKAWDSVDNRMGQLVYDNLFWNRTVKDLSMASVRSLGWNLGTVREIGGGVKDIFGNVDDVIHGRGTKMSYRTAYVMALPIVTGLYGAIYQYLHTGQAPQNMKDLFFPRNGAIDNKGQPARISLPTYMKDIYHYTTNPVQTVINKFSPVNNAVLEMMANKDFYGTQIRNVDDPVMQQVLDELTFVGGQFEPFGFRNLGRDTRTSAGSKIEPFIGITPAPYDINMTKSEREAYELAKGKIPVGSRTKEQAQHSQAKSKLASDYMASKDPAILDDAVSKGIISGKERRQIIKLSAMSNLQRLTRDLTFDEVNHVLKYATDAERPELEKILQKKKAGKEERGTWTPEEEKIYDQTFKT